MKTKTSNTAKKFSISMMFVMLAMVIGMSFGIPSNAVGAIVTKYQNNISETLTVGAANYTVKSTDDGRKYVELPQVTTSGGTLTYKATANNASQSEADIQGYSNSDGKYAGGRLYLDGYTKNYKVVYTLTSDSGVETAATINVAISTYTPSFEWEANTQQIIPTVASAGQKIVLPYPYIYGKDGKIINQTTNNNGTENIATDDFKTPADITGLSISITCPNGNVDIIKNETTGYYEWTIPTELESNDYGLYSIVYTYTASDAYTIKKEYTVEVGDAQEVELKVNNYKNASGTVSLPTSMPLYVEATLPTPVVVNTKASDAEVQVFTEITLECIPDEENAAKITYTTANTPSLREFKFTPKVAGKYTLIYNVTDFAGNTAIANGNVNGITSSKTSASGSGYVVAPYTEDQLKDMKTDAENGVLPTAEYMIPTTVKKGDTFALPAIFGIDKQSEFNDLSFERSITYKKADTTGSTTESYTSTQTNTDRKVEPNVVINYTFEYATTYTIRYYVCDAEGNSLLSKSFEVDVQDDYSDTKKPVVKFENLNNTSVNVGSEIKFRVSTADYRESDPSKVADERLNVKVTYKIGEQDAAPMTAKGGTYKDGYYTFTVPADLENNTNLVFTATATDDYKNIGSVTKTVKVLNYKTNIDAPQAGEFNVNGSWLDSEEIKEFKTLETITIPAITFTNANPYLHVYAEITCNGQVISNGTFGGNSMSGTAVTLKNKKFVANLAGEYAVNYVATGINGIQTYKTLTFKVIGEQKPSISVGSFESTYEYGDSIDLANVSITVNSEEVNYSENLIVLSGEEYETNEAVVNYINDNLESLKANGALICLVSGAVDWSRMDANNLTSIVAGKSGTITLKYWAVSTTGEFDENPTSPTSITVQNTKSIEVKVNGNGPITRFTQFDASAEDESVNRVDIPDATSTEGTITITAKYKNASSNLKIVEYAKVTGTEEEVAAAKAKIKDGYYGYFVATQDGYVVVTYQVTDGERNGIKTFEIGIGDINAPQINVTEFKSLIKSEYKVGEEITLDLTKIKVTDASTIETSDLVITVKRDGETVSSTKSDDNKTLTFKVDKVGTYTISIDVTDKAGNKAETASVTLSIPEKTSENTVSATVWGTILIIVALIVLGVVIYFFVKPTKSKVAVKTTTSAKKDDNKNDKIEV